jgi:prolipoprotein diacylglyceryltransferase
MRHFAMFLFFAILFFLYWKARQNLDFIRTFLAIILRTIVVEYVKESQGGFESTLGLLSTGQWLSIPFIIIGLYFIFTAEKPVKFRSCLKVISKSDIKKSFWKRKLFYFISLAKSET